MSLARRLLMTIYALRPRGVGKGLSGIAGHCRNDRGRGTWAFPRERFALGTREKVCPLPPFFRPAPQRGGAVVGGTERRGWEGGRAGQGRLRVVSGSGLCVPVAGIGFRLDSRSCKGGYASRVPFAFCILILQSPARLHPDTSYKARNGERHSYPYAHFPRPTTKQQSLHRSATGKGSRPRALRASTVAGQGGAAAARPSAVSTLGP